MGQKINPVAYRLPLSPTETWKSRWFTTNPKRYKSYLAEDVRLRKALMQKLAPAGVTRVEIERSLRSMRVIIFVTRPGVVIGRGGSGIEELKKFIYQTLGYAPGDKNIPKIDMPIEEVKEADLSAYLVATKIAEQLVRRMPARRVVNKAMERTMQSRANGIKVVLAGRIAGAEIARREVYHTGSVPLQTLRANVDYAAVPALTRSGYIGIKVWIYKGEKT
ncbi:30S ribosomal protein S3 [Candidatus Amesbacteria bacterium RIFCSPLOWO2_02_FULL_48_11]|uniref:Small ribosomal subunit protein uS3 n=4 Tax=Candidatus Amesiibacteriota TaxID=1752730 RepID=A0A1F4Z7L4_9BACT|nr:MAG: 30S ribosomal protein S3 [Candidatus Amesbacteria bacterium GW2011_GWC1_48_10]KKW01045.1 MAG: 30S ribosomal protein S3 [Candidatus Amesbacteria bacterium GW2011_GWA1_48_9]OGC89625.1 MAG: 30S ribosomal protein S3 [Candidatus Amesbacteria bacterium RBG_19FT_COMBO_48_16]OGC96869.1 MAG: 30S ribosomal protein S3 [Candidatus Amesbacteria bacterium RIFCSPHIGHO2_02_FULL_48_21]OGC97870.1 MAG: 30S ribosomal protein S3 [Candidatus Amesbacteria bacterium RBG_16_48_31]OGD01896.1 MAG: 30S ribosomal 